MKATTMDRTLLQEPEFNDDRESSAHAAFGHPIVYRKLGARIDVPQLGGVAEIAVHSPPRSLPANN